MKRYKIIYKLLPLLLTIFCCSFMFGCNEKEEININIDFPTIVEVGQNFVLPIEKTNSRIYSKNIIITDNEGNKIEYDRVNNSFFVGKIGTYNVEYSFKFVFSEEKRNFSLISQDSLAPEITFKDVKAYLTEEDYTLPEIIINDNSYGDIKKEVRVLKNGIDAVEIDNNSFSVDTNASFYMIEATATDMNNNANTQSLTITRREDSEIIDFENDLAINHISSRIESNLYITSEKAFYGEKSLEIIANSNYGYIQLKNVNGNYKAENVNRISFRIFLKSDKAEYGRVAVGDSVTLNKIYMNYRKIKLNEWVEVSFSDYEFKCLTTFDNLFIHFDVSSGANPADIRCNFPVYFDYIRYDNYRANTIDRAVNEIEDFEDDKCLDYIVTHASATLSFDYDFIKSGERSLKFIGGSNNPYLIFDAPSNFPTEFNKVSFYIYIDAPISINARFNLSIYGNMLPSRYITIKTNNRWNKIVLDKNEFDGYSSLRGLKLEFDFDGGEGFGRQKADFPIYIDKVSYEI